MRRLLPSSVWSAISIHYYSIVPKLFLSGLLFLLVFCSYAQQMVTGTVRSGDTAIVGVSVTVKGTNTATTTDNQGHFSISAPANSTLLFTHINYNPIETKAGKDAMNVQLELLDNNLGEVVVVGYNTQKRATVSGSISVVKGADLVKSPQPNLSNSLAGRFSGIVLNNRSGEPGYDGSSFTIRGLATTGNNDVLIVVDGVPGQVGGLERLNPNDIESISILKDASAAIYGSRSANGVILVTTKRGKTGKPVIDASFNQGFSSPTRVPKMADAPTYATISNEIAYYNNKAGGMNQQYSADEITKFGNGSDPLNYPNTDWADATLKKTALQNQANISINGGSENVHYYISAGSIYQDGIYKKGATKYRQYNFRSNIEANITRDFKVGLYLSGRQEDRNYPIASAGNIFRSIYRAYSTLPAIYPNGYPSNGIEGNNPVMMVTDIGGTTNNPTSVFNGILKGSYKIPKVKGLSIDGFAAFDKSWSFSKAFSVPYLLYSYNKTTNAYTPRVVGGSNNAATLTERQINISQQTYNIKINYQHTFNDDHNLNAFVGYEQSAFKKDSIGAYRMNFLSVLTPELSQGGTAATDQTNGGSSYSFTRKSYLGKVAYDFREKYVAEVQMRIDGSSTFPKGYQYGYFPSVSAAWRISKERFFENIAFVNNLKIRASYGALGNDNVGLFQYFTNYSLKNQFVEENGPNVFIVPGLDLTKLANPKIHWEDARKADIGIEGVLLRNINFEFIYFQQKRSNILTQRNASLPNVSGIVNPFTGDPLVPSENIGKVDNSGVEATLGYNNRSRKVHYGISGNFTYAKSNVVFIDEAAGTLAYQKKTGQPLNTYLLYNAIGIFRSQEDIDKAPHLTGAQPGDLIYEDYNKDGKITADDQLRTSYSNIPLITYGVVMSADYANFDLSMVFAGQSKVSQFVLPESGTVGNFYSSWADNRWSPTNPNGSYPRVDTRTSASVNGGQYKSTFWLNNGSFFRMKNIELGYNLPMTLLSRVRMQQARLYVSGFNLFTITKVKDYDPEGSSESGQFYPQQKIINIGVNVRF